MLKEASSTATVAGGGMSPFSLQFITTNIFDAIEKLGLQA